VGSGPIGVEASIALKQRGCEVFLIELLERILPQVFDHDSASMIKNILESQGISVFTHEKVIEIMGPDKVQGVITAKRTIKCDAVILATGMRPESDLLEGVLGRGPFGGITVDDGMGTEIPDIFACGDCTEAESLLDGKPSLSLLWHNARWQGEVAGSNASGIPRKYAGSLNITGLDVFGIQAVSIGSIAGDRDLDAVEIKRDQAYLRLVLSNGWLLGVQSINWDENLGPFLAAILRKEKIDVRKEVTPSFRCFPFGKNLWSRSHLKGSSRIMEVVSG
jgi:NADPH-dependent 2,4-dienoyl-CoA reductase/sulfur reductase-like enzyme